MQIYHKQLVSKSSRLFAKGCLLRIRVRCYMYHDQKTMGKHEYLEKPEHFVSRRSSYHLQIIQTDLHTSCSGLFGSIFQPHKMQGHTLCLGGQSVNMCKYISQQVQVCTYCGTAGPWDVVLQPHKIDEKVVDWCWRSLAAGSCCSAALISLLLTEVSPLCNCFTAELVIWKARSAS